MSDSLPPVPTDEDSASWIWRKWFDSLRTFILANLGLGTLLEHDPHEGTISLGGSLTYDGNSLVAGGWYFDQGLFRSTASVTTGIILNSNTNQITVKHPTDNTKYVVLDGTAGAVDATAGTIGGWTLGPTTLSSTNITLDDGNDKITIGNITLDGATSAISSGSGSTYVALKDGTGFQAGGETFSTAPFSVDTAGALKSVSGTIGGWTIASNTMSASNLTLDATNDRIYAGSGQSFIGITAGTGFSAGDETFADAEFSVTTAGALKSTSGLIGAWTIGATSLSGTDGGVKSITMTPGTPSIVATDGTYTTTLAADSLTTNQLLADGGLIGGWTINSDSITDQTTWGIELNKTSGSITVRNPSRTADKVVINSDGIVGSNTTLGTMFNLPTTGSYAQATTYTYTSTSITHGTIDHFDGFGSEEWITISDSTSGTEQKWARKISAINADKNVLTLYAEDDITDDSPVGIVYVTNIKPTFQSGIIRETVVELYTASVIRTSDTVGNGGANGNGIIINDQGIKGFIANNGSPITELTNDGKFYLGGTSGSLTWDGTSLAIEGSITLTNTISASDISDVDIYATDQDRIGLNEMQASYPDTPTGTGLFLGANNLGYYDTSAWKTYMADNGDFFLSGDAGGQLTWTAASNTLAISGTITVGGDGTGVETSSTAGNGSVAGVRLNSAGIRLYNASSSNPTVIMNASDGTFAFGNLVDGSLEREVGGLILQENDDELILETSGGDSVIWDGSSLKINGELNVTSNSSINSTVNISNGNITVGASGHIKGGQTGYNSGNGFFLGHSGNQYKFSVGNSSGNKLTWDGSTLAVAGSITSTSGTIGGWSLGPSVLTSASGNIVFGSNGVIELGSTGFTIDGPNNEIDMASSGKIRGGQAAYDSGTGFFLGYESSAYKFSIGNSSGNKMTWDGSAMTLTGALEASSFITDTNTANERVEINAGSNNEIHFYGDRGDGTIADLASIGITSSGGDNYVGLFGTAASGSSNIGVYGLSDTNTGVNGHSNSGVGITGTSNTSVGIYGTTGSSSSYGVRGYNSTGTGVQGETGSGKGVYGKASGGTGVYGESSSSWGMYGISSSATGVLGYSTTSYGIRAQTAGTSSGAPLYIYPAASANNPSHTATQGALWVTGDTVAELWFCTGGSTWVKIV